MQTRTEQTRRRLDARLSVEGLAERLVAPSQGWVRVVRKALGMPAADLARRMGVTQQAVAEIEQREVEGMVKLDTLQRAAQAMDCELVYAIVPRTSFDQIVKAQARKRASSHLNWVSHTSLLEDQAVDNGRSQSQLQDLADEFEKRVGLWREPVSDG